jgi:galactokinase/mevalonate kinase-like predicted kinase
LSLADVVEPHAGHLIDPYALAMFTVIRDAEFVAGYWRVPDDMEAWKQRFLGSPRLSYSLVNAATSAVLRDEERAQARKSELTRSIERGGFFAISERDFGELVQSGLGTETLVERHRGTDDPLLKMYRGTLLRAAGVDGLGEERGLEVRFAAHRSEPGLSISVKLDQIVWARSPVRLDLAGGWTDTPPYTNRYGGSVVNVAVDLNGQSPIQVFVRRSEDCAIRVHSIDLGVTETIRDTSNLRDYRNLASPFALPRAALVLIGVGAGLPEGAPLEAVLKSLGGGLEITLLCAVPKGSGLGTSSVLAGTILAALERFFGIESPRDELFLKVLEVEQMLTTGGGWQDQIGGLVGGVKYIESRRGLKPRTVIHQLDPWIFEDPASTARMTLFYSGITRLAKGLLQDVVKRANGMERAFLFTLGRIGELAEDAREAISLRDLDGLGWIIGESFRENKFIHECTTNADMERMIAATAPYRIGVKLLGAGGGGFALFVSQDIEGAQSLRRMLKEKYEDDRARLVEFGLNKKGLEVTVS